MITVCNPHWDHAERRARSWALRHGLVDGDEARRLARMGQGRMAGWLAPLAGAAEIALLAEWGAFIALVDDGFDREGQTPDQVRNLMDQLLGVLRGADGSMHPVPAVRALADLWERTSASALPGWDKRFVVVYEDFADATCAEAVHRASGEHLGLDDYLESRRRTITVLPVLAVLERGLPHLPALDGLRDATADIVAWTNDLRSARRELEEGTDNLVTVLARHHRCSLAEAATKARVMLAERMDEFDSTAEDGGRAELIRRARDGSLAWQRETHRNTAGSVTLGELRRGAPALARHLAAEVDAAGVVDDRCGSRVLESALVLALLRTTGTETGEQERLTEFLWRRRADADPLDRLLIDACLDPRRTAAQALDRAAALTMTLSSGTAGRGRLKALMLRTVLHLLCGAPLDHADLPPSAPDGVTTFTEVHLLSTRIIHAHACGQAHAVTDAERDRLVALMSSGRHRVLWEASATTHLLGLHAVATFRPGARVLDDGVLRLVLALNADGGAPFLDSQDLWLTAVAGLAFLADRTLRRFVPRMADLVAAWQAPDGGWPFATGMRQTDVDTTTRCMEFLNAAAPEKHRETLDRAFAYLTAIAGPDGTFPTWVRGDAPDLDMTAGAVLALAPRAAHHEQLLAGAVEFVLDAQQPDGTWERSWTVSESSGILRALDALHSLPNPSARITEATRRAVDRLAATQNPAGGWGQKSGMDSDVLSTAQAIPVLSRHGRRHEAGRAVTWLLARQQPDGGFSGPPDQVGPRPLPFDYPVLADILALAALHRATSPATTRGTGGWAGLASNLRGVLLRPEHAAYDHGRLLVNQRFDHVRPQAIAYPAVVEDVVECVNFARSNRIRLSLRSGGHSYAGYSTGQGLVLDVSSLNSATAGAGRARFGAGAKAGQAHQVLATAGAGLPLGRCPTVGLAGVTLGGGLSSFTRAWGLACDHLTEVEVVTADGRIRQVHPGDDLFWASCGGGGGNFGVTTALEFATEDVRDLAFTKFIVTWPGTAVADVLRGWSQWKADPATPRAVCGAFEQLSDSGLPALPAVTGTFIGAPAELEPVLDRLTAAVGTPETQRTTLPAGYVQAASEAERWGAGTWGPRVAFAAKSHIVRGPLSSPAATDLAAALYNLHGLTGVGGASGLLIDALGGAVDDRSRTATAFPHRDAVGVVQYHSYWHRETASEHVERRLHWLRDVHATMQPHLGPGGYTNGMDPELADWPDHYHAENYPRLQQIKAAYDPDQVFTFPQAVIPVG